MYQDQRNRSNIVTASDNCLAVVHKSEDPSDRDSWAKLETFSHTMFNLH